VALDVEDLAFDLLVTIRASKTDQEQAGAQVAVPFARAGNELCAVRTLRAYLEAGWDPPRPGVQRAAPRRHPVIDQRLSDQSVALIVKRRARTAGVPAAELSGHSLRAGYATAAAAAGVEERKIANVTRHKNLPVLRRYIRTRHRRSTTSATCSDPKPTQGSVGVPPSSSPPAALGWRPSRAAQRQAPRARFGADSASRPGPQAGEPGAASRRDEM
jgi:integrase